MKKYTVGIIGNGFVGESQAFAFSPTSEVKIYDNTSAAGVIKIHLKWGTAANEPLTMNFDGDGVRFETAAFVDVTNCDFVVAYYN